MQKIHLHDEQFDGAAHAWCGRGSSAVAPARFEATAPAIRCKVCEKEWFPRGQPDWHLRAAQTKVASMTAAGGAA